MANPAIVMANYYQFARGQKIIQQCVKSRMVLFCKSGKGKITVNNIVYEVSTGDIFYLPWKRSLTYHADNESPFLVGALHIIPEYSKGSPIIFEVAHKNEDPLFNDPSRNDSETSKINAVIKRLFSENCTMIKLAEFSISHFKSSTPTSREARIIGELVLNEADRFFFPSQDSKFSAIPNELEKIVQYIENRIHEPFTLSRLVRFSGKSTPTLCRWFQKYYHKSPISLVIELKIKKASEMLKETNISVSRIGQSIGIEDPYYFSKLYKKVTGKSPSTFRKKSLTL